MDKPILKRRLSENSFESLTLNKNNLLPLKQKDMTQETTVNPEGLKFKRRNSKEGVSPFDLFQYDLRTSVIKKPDGSTVFEMKNVEVLFF